MVRDLIRMDRKERTGYARPELRTVFFRPEGPLAGSPGGGFGGGEGNLTGDPLFGVNYE